MHFELSPLVVWIALWIVNTSSKFQVNIFSNEKHYKMSVFAQQRHQTTTPTMPIAIPPKTAEPKIEFLVNEITIFRTLDMREKCNSKYQE